MGATASNDGWDSADDAADVIVVQPYAADSGDRCPMGNTEGRLGWHLGARVVEVRGIVADRPLHHIADNGCGEDGRYTEATFTAKVRDTAVAERIVRADNGHREISFGLSATLAIEKIVVQVCRIAAALPEPIEVCGEAQEFRRLAWQPDDLPPAPRYMPMEEYPCSSA